MPTRRQEAAVARRFGADRHRPVPHRAHVLRGRAHQRRARDDPGRRRSRTPQGAGQAAADAARRFRGPVPRDGRHAGDDPPARSAAARVRAARRGRAARAGHGDEGLAGQDQDARRGAARVQPDARAPRLPAGHHLSGDHRDAGARHLRGRPQHEGPGRGRQGRDHGAAGGHGARVQRAGRGHPRARPPRCSPSAARRCTTCSAR